MFSNGFTPRRVLMDASNCLVRASHTPATTNFTLKDLKSSTKSPLMTACNITAEVQASCPALDMSAASVDDKESRTLNDVFLGSDESDLEDDDDDDFDDEIADSGLTNEIVSGSDENSGYGRNSGARKRARRLPVEDFKYQVLVREGKITYACRACYATYRHKKSLNKHWRDKHALLASIESVPSSNSTATNTFHSNTETPTSLASTWINGSTSSIPILDMPLEYKENVTNANPVLLSSACSTKRRLSVDTTSPQSYVKRHKPLPVPNPRVISSSTPTIGFQNSVSAFRPPNNMNMSIMQPNFTGLEATAASITNPFTFGFGSQVTPPQHQSHPNFISQQDAIARFMAAYQWNQVATRHSLNQQLLLSSSMQNQMQSQQLPNPIICPAKLGSLKVTSSVANTTPVSSIELHNDQMASRQLQHQQHMPPDFMMPPPNLEHLQSQREIGLSKVSNECESTNALDLTLSVKNSDNPLDLSASAAIASQSTPAHSISSLRFSNPCGIPSNLLQPLAIYAPPIHDPYYSRVPTAAPFHLLPFLSPQMPQNICGLVRSSLTSALLPDSLNPTLEHQLPPPLPRVDTSPESNGSSSSVVDTAPSSSSSVSLKERDSPYGADDERRRNGGRQPPTICMQCHQQFHSGFELNMHFRTSHLSQLALEFDNVKSWKTSALEEVHHNLDQNIVKLESGESIGFQCPECHYFAKWPTELQKHIMVHSDVRPHVCLICGSTYKWKWDLGRHFDKTHGGGVLMPNPYKKNGNVANNNVSNSVTTNDNMISRANSVTLSTKVVTATTVTKELPVSPKLVQAVSNRLAPSSVPVGLSPLDSAIGSHSMLHSVVSPVNSIFSRSVRSILTSSSPKPTSQLYQQQKRHSVLHEDNKDYQLIHNNESNDSLRARLKKKIQQSASKRRSAPATCAVATCARDAEFVDDTDTNGACPLPFVCPMCGFRARWKSELKSHATNHTTCKPFLCPFCQYRSKWKWDVVKHMKRCNWKKHDGGPPSVGPPIQISNKEMQALIIYKPPAKEEITNLAEAMLYADENSPFYEGRDTFDEDEDEMRNYEHNVSGTSCTSVAVFPEPESLNPTSPTCLMNDNSSSSSSKQANDAQYTDDLNQDTDA